MRRWMRIMTRIGAPNLVASFSRLHRIKLIIRKIRALLHFKLLLINSIVGERAWFKKGPNSIN